MSGGNWKDMFKGIQTNDINLVEYHLVYGTDPNYQHPEFMALPLAESIRFNHLPIAKLLLENGADPSLTEVWGGESPLSLAITAKNEDALNLLRAYIK